MDSKRYFFLVLILGTLTALGPFSIDMYLPGFKAIAYELHTTVAQVSLSLASFFIGISAGQLLYGPLLDKYGRKKPLYFGLSLYIVASFCCLWLHSLHMLIALRFIQAIGSCAAAVASIAMVRDLFPVEDSAKVFSLLMLVVGLSPMLAPAVGGYVTSAFGWRWVFIILAIIAILIFIAVIFFLPDNYEPESTLSLKPKPIINNFLSVIKEPQFYTYALAGAVAFSGLFAYVSGSPLVFMDIYKLSAKVYGYIFAGLSVGFIGASQLNTLMLKKFTSQQLAYAALVSQVAVSIVFVIAALSGWLGLAGTIFMILLFLCCLGFINPNTSALSMAPFTRNAGSASSLMGAIQLGVGSLASVAVSMFNTRSVLPLAMIMCLSSVIALLILLICRKNIKTLSQNAAATVVIH
jgi:DHA1 family bicyclomycin/chloramphenicol resistance-like MFS transporter